MRARRHATWGPDAARRHAPRSLGPSRGAHATCRRVVADLERERAHTLARAGRRPEARALLAQIARLYVYSSAARRAALGIADIDFELGGYDLATLDYEAWIAAHPNDPEVPYAKKRASEASARYFQEVAPGHARHE